jgi:hypothetical protein
VEQLVELETAISMGDPVQMAVGFPAGDCHTNRLRAKTSAVSRGFADT